MSEELVDHDEFGGLGECKNREGQEESETQKGQLHRVLIEQKSCIIELNSTS